MATDGLTFQNVLDDCLRFWGLDGNEGEDGAENGHEETKSGTAAAAANAHSMEAQKQQSTKHKKKRPAMRRRFCIADKGGALRRGAVAPQPPTSLLRRQTHSRRRLWQLRA